MMGLMLFRSGGSRKLLAIRVAALAVLLLATFIFHVSGTALVELKIARVVILIALVVGAGWYSRRRRRVDASAERDHLDA